MKWVRKKFLTKGQMAATSAQLAASCMSAVNFSAATSSKRKRTRYEVRPTTKKELRENPLRGAWTVTQGGAVVESNDTQKGAIKAAVHFAVHALKARGELATLKIKGRNGRIRDERTYGADPRRTKG